jgi:hypothetical protein
MSGADVCATNIDIKTLRIRIPSQYKEPDVTYASAPSRVSQLSEPSHINLSSFTGICNKCIHFASPILQFISPVSELSEASEAGAEAASETGASVVGASAVGASAAPTSDARLYDVPSPILRPLPIKNQQ